MSSELKPCPFCGSEATLAEAIVQYVRCLNEDCKTFGPSGHDEASAIAAWNTRHDEK